MTETTPTYSVETEAIADPLLELKLKVAPIAGWENIHEWNPNPKAEKPKKVFQGTNKKHPELGIFVPDYTSDLNAIVAAFDAEKLGWTLSSLGYASCGITGAYAETPAIALCKLLIELAPNLPKSEEVQVIDDDGDIDEPKVIEAAFG